MQPSKYEVLISSLSVNKGSSNELMLSMLLRPVSQNMIFTNNTVINKQKIFKNIKPYPKLAYLFLFKPVKKLIAGDS